MKILLDMVISPNGYIAREDGDEDWLPEEGWGDFVALAQNFGNIVMGRETFTQVMSRYEGSNFGSIPCQHKVIVTRDVNFAAPAGYQVVHSPEEAVEYIRSHGLETLFLIGGGTLNGEFMKRGLVDEIQLTVVPYIVGKGRPVFGRSDFDAELRLVESKALPDGRVTLKYLVQK